MLNFAQLKFLLTGLTLLTVLAACSDDNTSTEAPPATIEIAELSPEADNVSFRLIPTNAISMAYKIEIERGGDADFVSIESSEEKTVEITDLTPETSYKLTAIAYNADQRPSNPATATFTTPEKPTTPDPDKATISIEFGNLYPENRQCSPLRLQGRCSRRNGRIYVRKRLRRRHLYNRQPGGGDRLSNHRRRI